MLNSIWAGLIIISIVFATAQDVRDEIIHRHHNGEAQTASWTETDIDSVISLQIQDTHIVARIRNKELIIATNQPLPESWKIIADHINQPTMRATLLAQDTQTQQLTLALPPVHWQKSKAMLQAAFDMAEFAVKLALGLIGIMALWLGLMHIAEHSGLIQIIVHWLQPALRRLFPDIPPDHPAFGSISMNLAANMLGLGNAATPMGIKAMQQLQELNTKKDEASHAMCMFLALNTSSVQLLPPVTLIALLGAQVSELFAAIIMATCFSTLAAILAAKYFARRRA
ncbi:MAG: spore maturation protein [Pseudomonadota bacterium]|nr:spore maturation protein [Pseudomonadota bacterium]